jgi:hypothetical protein
MKIYKFLDIDNHEEISGLIYEYLKNHTNVLANQWPNEFLNHEHFLEHVSSVAQIIRNMNLQTLRASVVTRLPGQYGGVHIDDDKTIRILWPVKNCKGSLTKFFNVDESYVTTEFGPGGDRYFLIDQAAPLIQIDQVELTGPIVFCPWIPHGVWTNAEYLENRITLCIGFTRSPTELLD